jgi:TolB-like protein/Flp pilus assembly protein TadD
MQNRGAEMLRLSIFGRFRAADALGNEIPIKSKKARALLAYLALPPGKERSREEVMALLWSERGDEQARSSLRQALSGLRKELGEIAVGALKVTDEWLALEPRLVDVEPASPGDVLLSGLHISDPAFDEWLRDERLRHDDVAAPYNHTPELSLPDKPSIAVLPFTNLSADPEQEYFSDGITEDIITELTRFRSLFVIARNSSFTFKGEAVDVSEVGRKLGVQYVVEGSIRKAGNRVRITAQLVEAESGNHLWAERYDREIEDIFAVQDEISRTISSTLADRVEGDRLEHVKSRDETSLVAYDFILRGRELALKYTRDDNAKAGEMFTKATELSPDNAQAWAWLAQCLAWDFEGWWVEDPEQSLELAVQCANKAFRINANVSQAQTALAYTYLYKRQHDQAIHHFRQALALVPGDAWIATHYGTCLFFAGDADAGLEEIARSERLSPMDTGLAGLTVWGRGMAHYTMRQYGDALAAFREIPNPPVEVRGWLAACYAQLGEDKAARAALADFEDQAREEFPTFPGDTPGGWARYWWCMEPYRDDDDLEHLLEGLRKAGLDV